MASNARVSQVVGVQHSNTEDSAPLLRIRIETAFKEHSTIEARVPMSSTSETASSPIPGPALVVELITIKAQ
jgi:hypothetical protein